MINLVQDVNVQIMFDNCNALSLNKPSFSLLQNIVFFGSPIDSNSQDLTKFKSVTSLITHYKIHITYYI